jgi:thioredoxin-related protein
MRSTVLSAAALLFATACGALFADGIAWRTDPAAAQAEAAKSGRMMMVDVYTDWCSWCKKLDSETYTDRKVIAQSAGFVALKLNPEKGAEPAAFARKYGVSGYPTILFLDADGGLANKVVGYQDAAAFSATLARTVDYAPKVKTYAAELKAGRTGNAAALLSMLTELGRMEEAAPVFDSLRTSGALDRGAQERTAYALAGYWLDASQWDKALASAQIVEDLATGSDMARQAVLMHAIALYYAKGRAAALGFLDARGRDAKTPAGWKKGITDLADRMKATKE